MVKQLAVAGSDSLLFLRLDNLGDELACNAGSVASLRALAPRPGHFNSAGLRVDF